GVDGGVCQVGLLVLPGVYGKSDVHRTSRDRVMSFFDLDRPAGKEISLGRIGRVCSGPVRCHLPWPITFFNLASNVEDFRSIHVRMVEHGQPTVAGPRSRPYARRKTRKIDLTRETERRPLVCWPRHIFRQSRLAAEPA